jgi:hypothetical protein
MCRSRQSHTAALPPDRESPPTANQPVSAGRTNAPPLPTGERHNPAMLIRASHRPRPRPSQRCSSRRIARHARRPARAAAADARRSIPMSSTRTAERDCNGAAGGWKAGGPQSGESASEQCAAAHASSSTHAVRQRTASRRSACSPRSEMFSDHLDRDLIRVGADCGSCLAAGLPAGRGSTLPQGLSVRFASSSCAACQNYRPARPKHRAIVGIDRGAGAFSRAAK